MSLLLFGFATTVFLFQNCETPIEQTEENTSVQAQLAELPSKVEYQQVVSETLPSNGQTLLRDQTQTINIETGEVNINASQELVGCLADDKLIELIGILSEAEVCAYQAPEDAVCAQVLVDPYSVLIFKSAEQVVLGARTSSCGDTTILCGEKDNHLREFLSEVKSNPQALIGACN